MGIINSRLKRRVTPENGLESKTMSSGSHGKIVSTISKTLHNPSINDASVIVWVDGDVNDSDIVYQSCLSRLQHILISFHRFNNVKDCLKYLSSSSSMRNVNIHLVTSSQFFPQIWTRVKSMNEVQYVYILSSSSNNEDLSLSDYEHPKLKGVFDGVEQLCNSVKRSTRHVKEDSLVMSVIPSMKYQKKDLSEINHLFIYWMLVKQIILQTKYDHQSIKELTKISRNEYYSNTKELSIIEEFERDYDQHSPIWWYTRDCFLSQMINRALQTQDIEIIIRMGFFIKDLYEQLEKLQNETQKSVRLPVVAYRSQNVSDEDLEKMKNIQGNLLSFNHFILADSTRETSLNVTRQAQKKNNSIGILFSMKVESKSTLSPYASLQNVSFSSEQNQLILFSMHSVFRIVDLKEIENRLWEMDLTLIDAKDEEIVSLNDVVREETKDSTGWFKLAQWMSTIRDFDHAKDIYYVLLELIPEKEVLKIARIYNELGVIDDELGEYATALEFYEKSIAIRRHHLPPNHRSLSIAYNNMGEVHRQMGNYVNALSTHKKGLDIKEKVLRPNHLSFATTYNNIGLANELLGEFTTALEFYQKALEIKRKALPADHQELATTYNNIGELHRAMGNYTAALLSLEKALAIRLKKFPPMDPCLAITYNNIGLVHRELGDFVKAVSYLEKSLEVKVKHFSSNHPSLAFSYNNIGDVQLQMGEFSKALSTYQMALDVQEKALSPTHPEVAITLTNIGAVHQAMGNYAEALSFYQKAIEIRQKTLPSNHPSLGISYNNMGHLYQLMGEYPTAIQYYEKTLKLQQKTLTASHPALAATYNNLADVQRKLGNHKKALSLYKKSLEIKKKSLPHQHPNLIITYNNMGVIYQGMKNYTGALDCYKQTLEIQQKTLPPNHPDLASVYNNIGVSHQSLKEYTVALDHFNKALDIQQKALPANHPDIALTHNSMATVYVNLGDFKRALEHERKAVDIGTKSLPADHPNLLTYKNYYERIKIKVDSM